MTEGSVEAFDQHLNTLGGQRLTFPGGRSTAFNVTGVMGETIQVVGGGQTIGLKRDWLRDAFRVLIARKTLTRSGIGGQVAQYRSGYIFAILATYPGVTVVKPFPTKLTWDGR